MRTFYCLYQESSKPSKTNTKFLLNFGVQQVFFFFFLCYVMLYRLYYAMSFHVMSIAILVISFHVMLCYSNYLFLFLFFKKPGGWWRGEGNSIVFHLSFLTHSACQYDVT